VSSHGFWLFLAVSWLVVASTNGALAEEKAWSDELIGEALQAVLLTQSDLSIRRDYVPVDPFRLEVVSHLLEQPFDAGPYARTLSQGLEGKRWSVAGLLAGAATPLGSAIAVSPRAGPDLEAGLRKLLDASGSEVPDEMIEMWLSEAADLPDELTGALAVLIEGAAAAHHHLTRAFRRLADEEKEELLRGACRLTIEEEESEAAAHELAKRVLAQAEKVDFDELFRAGMALGGAVDGALGELAVAPRPDREADGGTISRSDKSGRSESQAVWLQRLAEETGEQEYVLLWDTPLGEIRVGGVGPNRYLSPALITIDLGGDDYYGRDDGALGEGGAPISVLIDLSGDDTHRSGDFSLGSGYGGIGMLIDIEGDDLYQGGNFTQGAALVGVGVLWDGQGEDCYLAETQGQGAATFGIGLLADLEGDDLYAAEFFSQGFGGVAALGAIIEGGGNDTYAVGHKYPDHREPDYYACLSQGFGYGWRDISSGGVGVIADVAGNDTYIADYFAQGSSYWFALGILVDEGGNDKYVARRYSQGAGIHLAVGVLSDREGNDDYLSWGVSQGCGHDLALGLLVDDEGNDSYLANWLSQGAGNANGFGILADGGGDDIYLTRPGRGQGQGNLDRGYESVGVLVDREGHDVYSGAGADGAMWREGMYGIGLDREPEPDSLQEGQE
jgi:hypothetical protein